MELETNVAFLLQYQAQHHGVFGRNETLTFFDISGTFHFLMKMLY